MTETVGFIGLGSMGLPMACKVLDAGYRLRVYNRTPGKAVELLERGAREVKTPAETVEPGGIVITMLANDAALETVTLGEHGMVAALGADGIHLSMSTVSPHLARRLAEAHRAHGSHYLAAPVLGRPTAAAAGKLFILLSGMAAAKRRVSPLLEAMGQGTHDLGEDLAQGHIAKLAANFMILASIETYAETLTFAEKNGIGRMEMMKLLTGTILNAPLFHLYGELLAKEEYTTPGFKLALGLKDIELILEAGANSRMPLPAADLVHNRLLAAMAKGYGEMDMTALALGVAEDAGLPRGKG
ncbi:MAG TPA: NAD(P)-dependent oxidoreductase [Candidatus Competibacter sp.]|nr:NAD(P)-dependent oxidoreductase [Candidatus Competibacteraceae bacterium]HRW65960.1 NAD(P)-dependent oxidoreductase [Candidatus Competibacter sp.]